MYVDYVGNDSPMRHANGPVHVVSFAIFHSQHWAGARNTKCWTFAGFAMNRVGGGGVGASP